MSDSKSDPDKSPTPRWAASHTRVASPNDRTLVGGKTVALQGGQSRLELKAGVVVGETYQVLNPLGEGGMGVVVQAHDLRLERQVALKFILPDQAMDDEARRRFTREARAMALIRHNNVVTVHALEFHDEFPFIVMEYVEGVNLAMLMASLGGEPMPVDQAVRIIVEAAAGLDAIHQAGAVHLDIKPSNILVGEGFRVVLTDFGVSRLVNTDKAQGLAGTPNYLAREVALGEEPTIAADIYALGVTAYELMVGRLPYGQQASASDVIVNTARQVPNARSFGVSLPPRLEAVLRSALDKDPSARPSSAGEFARLLRSGLDESQNGEGTLRFVVVDDDAAARQLVSMMLGHAFESAAVTTFADGASALDAMGAAPPSLALVDLEMPGMNGVELTAAVREHDRLRTVPLIVMTGVGGAADWRVLAGLGANAFLVKPFDDVELELAIRRLLGLPTELRPPGSGPSVSLP